MIQLDSDKQYGPFRVFDAQGKIIACGGMTESDATDLAYRVNGRIEHQDPDTKIWYRW